MLFCIVAFSPNAPLVIAKIPDYGRGLWHLWDGFINPAEILASISHYTYLVLDYQR